ncbi:MAG TPA: endonuclease Q family protein [Candidatus Omnitrophota bacterium]|nr:endonuclease Q family protein [Candidatus Omnitrophota bacterium]
MPFIVDLHIHSKYSRATAKDMDIENLVKWAKIKGVGMLGSGDFTHPAWLAELEKKLSPKSPGVYDHDGVDFILTGEVSNIYFKAGRTRKVHNIIAVPDFETAEEAAEALSDYGDLDSDGRPIMHLECDRMVKMLFGINPDILVIPAHAWTPHFSIFGSNSGFDSPAECFEGELSKIFSIETGLSSDPEMNWRWSELDRFCLTSHSDAHSPHKIGREANVFKDNIDYPTLVDTLKTKDNKRFLYTIEFFPEEGKYHWDGHRACGERLSPEDAVRSDNLCPACGKKLTIGVMHRLSSLADRPDGYVDKKSPRSRKLVPLAEIIGSALEVSPDSVSVGKEYFKMIKNFGTEFGVLLDAPEEALREKCLPKVAQGVINVRSGNLDIEPGYDGEYGKVNVLKDDGSHKEKQLSFL